PAGPLRSRPPPPPPRPQLFPYTTRFRSNVPVSVAAIESDKADGEILLKPVDVETKEDATTEVAANQSDEETSAEADSNAPQTCKDRKSTRLNSSHVKNSYAVFRLKKSKNEIKIFVGYHVFPAILAAVFFGFRESCFCQNSLRF